MSKPIDKGIQNMLLYMYIKVIWKGTVKWKYGKNEDWQ